MFRNSNFSEPEGYLLGEKSAKTFNHFWGNETHASSDEKLLLKCTKHYLVTQNRFFVNLKELPKILIKANGSMKTSIIVFFYFSQCIWNKKNLNSAGHMISGRSQISVMLGGFKLWITWINH